MASTVIALQLRGIITFLESAHYTIIPVIRLTAIITLIKKLLVQFSAHKSSSKRIKLADFDDWGQSTRRLDGGEQKINDDEGSDGCGSCPAVERIVIALFQHFSLNIEPSKALGDHTCRV